MWEKVINYQLSTLDLNSKLTYYQARHSYATEIIIKNVPLNDLATLLGRKIQNIQTYIKQVQSVDHLIKVISANDKIKID